MIAWTRNGEWLELPLPSSGWKALKPGAIDELAAMLPVPSKYFLRLASKGLIRAEGDRIRIHAFPREAANVPPEPGKLDIVFEDDFCLVINKPAGMSVHPAEAGQKGTLAAAVAHYYMETGQACAIRHIHRLDQDTTGAILYAKNEWAHVLLDEHLRERRIHRKYEAIAAGRFKIAQGRIDAPIGKDRHTAGRRVVSPKGEHAVTHYCVLKRFAQAALIELELETGRTHQIRVHLSHLGHPLYGDTLYGGSSRDFHRQALHAKQLSFPHPITGEMIVASAHYPQDFSQLLDRLSHA
ncbi:RluA family pseudouridine synthase [Paenibacillus whitsoniae]|uniref:Pseudouridine synthase n=1 Tax=Paenibacillus whitsoniae TaxID=2496558 RepID=A0A430JAH2_9BACL|nr:RluA family pseudouridine synthase [Paenibacillus whitsoniae]RTE08028.1 RluA family pseudouridine synthase [Paenibacillus whitsoniae]